MIEVHELKKSYGPVRALAGISFRIDAAEIVGLLGPNGAGKSTAIKILTTFIAPDSGSVVVQGKDVTRDPLGVRREIGYLPEDNPLYADMKVGDYLMFLVRARHQTRGDWRTRYDYVVSRTGISHALKKTIGTLSKGFRQRVGLAQALLHDPRILILDEPTSGLDPNQILEIRELIREVGRDRTVILSTHILQEVSALCNRAVIIHKGSIVADGSLDDLAKRGSSAGYRARIRGPRESVLAALRSEPAIQTVEAEAANDRGGQLFRTHSPPEDLDPPSQRQHAVRVANGAPAPPLGNGADVQTYQIAPADPGADLGERIFEIVRDKGFALSELIRERASIEHIFHQLTMTS